MYDYEMFGLVRVGGFVYVVIVLFIIVNFVIRSLIGVFYGNEGKL